MGEGDWLQCSSGDVEKCEDYIFVGNRRAERDGWMSELREQVEGRDGMGKNWLYSIFLSLLNWGGKFLKRRTWTKDPTVDHKLQSEECNRL